MSAARKRSYLTFTDQFCGAGGSSIGATAAGLEGRMALNHWKLAIETHNTNFPAMDHDCTDISACDPRRYPSTDILITSPECTTHSPAGGTRRHPQQRDLFRKVDDPAAVRSRATMFDVVRFTEYHQYRIVIVENVVEVTRWELFPDWLRMMTHISPGYSYRIVSLNSMHAHPTPQSRDRVYIVFWQKGNRAPELDITPPAPCQHCAQDVRAVQTWKRGRTVGKYRKQYIYTCPRCRRPVEPYYYAALNAIDFTIPAQRIGDRSRPLKPRTLERIQFGLEKYGRRPLVIRTNMTSGVGCRVRPADEAPLDTQPGSNITAIVEPAFLMNAGSREVAPKSVADAAPAATGSDRIAMAMPFVVETTACYGAEPSAGDEVLPTQTTRQTRAIVTPFIVQAAYGDSGSRRSIPLDEPLRTVHAGGGNMGVVQPSALVTPFLLVNRTHADGVPLDATAPTVATGGHLGLVQGAAVVTLRNSDGPPIARGLDAPLPAQVASCTQDFLLQQSPVLLPYYRTKAAVPADDAAPTMTTLERIGMVTGDLPAIEDCFFRMMQPGEIGATMAFPRQYVVLGTKREKVKQFGNAVTPPAMTFLIQRCVASLAPEKAR